MYVVVNGRRQVVRQSQTLLRTGPWVTVTGRGREIGQKFSQNPLLPVCVWPVTFLHFPPVTAGSQPRSRDCFLVLDNGVGDRAANRVRQSRQDLARRVWNSQEPEAAFSQQSLEEDANNGLHEISFSVVFYIRGMEVQSRLIHRGKERPQLNKS